MTIGAPDVPTATPVEVVVRQESTLADDSFDVHVFGTTKDGSPVSVRVQSPFSNKEDEDDLNWYCEAADREPFSVSPRLHHVEKSLRDYGTRLFKMLFSKPGATLPTDRPVTVRIIGCSRFCSLHWELLRDPVRGPVALDPLRVLVRDVMRDETSAESQVPHAILSYPTLNVLFLTARRRVDERDIPLRVESLAVMNMVKEHDLPLRFDLVRPGSLSALQDKLSEKEPGFYHILHLDCHGASGEHDFRVPYQQQSNRLLLETERADYVSVGADQIAHIVERFKIPIVFTSACRSGQMNLGAPSFAEDLFLGCSVQCVLVMALSVLVDTTAKFVAAFYLAMLEGEGTTYVCAATRCARRAMSKDLKREGVLGTIRRQDWWIPQLYQRAPVGSLQSGLFQRCTWEEVALQFPSPDERAKIWEDNAQYSMRKNLLIYDAVDEKKFIGRDEDLRLLECKVFSHDRSDNVILLYGMMGCGKTAFTTYVSWWWCVTGMVRDKFVFRLHERQFSLNNMIWHIYRQLFNVVNYDASDPSDIQIEEDRRRVTEHLRKYCYVVVIDSAERLCSRADQHNKEREDSISESESESDLEEFRGSKPQIDPRHQQREEIAKWLAKLQGGRTIVLVGSRGSSESLLMKFIENKSNNLDLATIIGKYPKRHIGNLSSEASKALVKQILNPGIGDQDGKRYATLCSYQMLDLYAGNPLVINLVVGSFNAKEETSIRTSEELADMAQKYLANPSSSTLVMKSLEYSFNLLSTSQQEALLFLAPFKGSVTSKGLSHYADELERANPSSPKFNRSAWDSAIQMAVRWGLLTIHERVKRQRGQQAWRIHACLSILLMKKLSIRLNSSPRGTLRDLANGRGYSAIDSADKATYLRPMLKTMHLAYWHMALYLYDLLRNSDKDMFDAGRVMTEIDFWNLNRVLRYALEAKRPFYGIFLPMYSYLAAKNDITQRYSLCRRIVAKIGVYTRLSDIPSSNQIYRLDVPRMYHLYGMLLGHNRLHKLDEAEIWFSRTKKMWEESRNQKELAVTEHELGWVAMNKRDYELASVHYKKALELSEGPERSSTLMNMGLLAAFEQDYESALMYHEQARAFYEEQGDASAMASAYHNMAIVSCRVHRNGQAEVFAKKSLTTRKERDEIDQKANVYQLRGNIAQRRAREAADQTEALKFLQIAKKKYNKAMLTYNCDSGFHYGVIPEREMLHENYGLLMRTQRKFIEDGEEKELLLRTEMDSYERVTDGPYPKAKYNLGLIHEELGELGKAYECYSHASKMTPNEIKFTLDREACRLACAARARCLATGTGVEQNEHEALTLLLRSRGEIGDGDPMETLGLWLPPEYG